MPPAPSEGSVPAGDFKMAQGPPWAAHVPSLCSAGAMLYPGGRCGAVPHSSILPLPRGEISVGLSWEI